MPMMRNKMDCCECACCGRRRFLSKEELEVETKNVQAKEQKKNQEEK